MLSLKNGGVAPAKHTDPLVALMTPSLRELFEETVEPLLELVRRREELAAKERSVERYEGKLEGKARDLALYKSLEGLSKLLKEAGGDGEDEEEEAEEDGDEAASKGGKWGERVEATKKAIRKDGKGKKKAEEAVASLRKEVAKIARRKKVGPALAELEAPIIPGGYDGSDESDTDESESDDDESEEGGKSDAASSTPAPARGPCASSSASPASSTKPSPPAAKKKARGKAPAATAAAASSAAAASTAAASAAANPSSSKKKKEAPAKKKARKAQKKRPPLSPDTWLPALLKEHTDPASHVLGFLGSPSALGGIGTASRSLRKAVKATTPCLALRQRDRISTASLDGYDRLLELSLDSRYARQMAWAVDIIAHGLPARLESFRCTAPDPQLLALLTKHPWPRLQTLGVSSLPAFLEAVTARPKVVFPRLRMLGVAGIINGRDARALLALMDRGAFPALTTLIPNARAAVTTLAPDGAGDVTQLAALLGRLSLTGALHLSGQAMEQEASWEPIAARLAAGRAAAVTNLTIDFGYATSDQRASTLLTAIGSGAAFPRLMSLDIQVGWVVQQPVDGDLLPDSLPALRTLSVGRGLSRNLVASLLGAAGGSLGTLSTSSSQAAAVVRDLMLQQDYPWLPTLRELTLSGSNAADGWGADAAGRVVSVLTCVPALRSLSVYCPNYDELIVRLLVAAETRAVPAMPTLERYGDGSDPFSAGSRLLLLLWLKRQAKKAVEEGAGAAVKWDVPALVCRRLPLYMGKLTKTCLKQIEEAWEQAEAQAADAQAEAEAMEMEEA